MSRRRRPLGALAPIAMAVLIGACGSSATAGGGSPAASSHGQAVKFSDCMRANGVSNFPDPSASGNLTIDQVANRSSVNTNTPAWQHAIGACKRLEPTGFTGGRRSARQQAAVVKFAQCIRASGVPDFPDPVNGQPIVDTNLIPSSNQPGGMDALHAAMAKCGAIYSGQLGLRGQ